jgi:hypothetical protein
MNKKNIDYDKYANIIVRAFRKFLRLKEKNIMYGGDVGLGKWLVICNKNIFDDIYDDKLLWLGKIIGVTGWKIWQDKNNSDTTCCICIYCGINEKKINLLEQYKWILIVGNKILKSDYLHKICLKDSIYFKENIKTRQRIYSHTHCNVSSLKLDFDYKCDFLDD